MMNNIWYFSFNFQTQTKPANEAQYEFQKFVQEYHRTLLIGDEAFLQFKAHLQAKAEELKKYYKRTSKFNPKIFIDDYSVDTKFLFGDNFSASAEKVSRIYPGIQLEIGKPLTIDFDN